MTIVASMLWRQLDAPGHDACSLERNEAGWGLRGAAAFRHDKGPAWILYAIQCDAEWQAVSAQLRGAVGKRRIDVAIARRDGSWTLNGAQVPKLEHLTDIDLAFTPATNLLHLRRVAIGLDESVRLPVAWFELDTGALTELPQIYRRLSETELSYEAPSVGYEAILQLAPNGFIRRYPQLWEAEAEL